MTLSATQELKRRSLHGRGWSDRMIASQVGVDRSTIGCWRRRRGLTANRPKPSDKPSCFVQRRRLYDMGLSDGEIGAKQGINRTNIRRWRYRNYLPANFDTVEERRGKGDGRMYLPSLDTIGYGSLPDPSWSSWLEEMGATVW